MRSKDFKLLFSLLLSHWNETPSHRVQSLYKFASGSRFGTMSWYRQILGYYISTYAVQQRIKLDILLFEPYVWSLA